MTDQTITFTEKQIQSIKEFSTRITPEDTVRHLNEMFKSFLTDPERMEMCDKKTIADDNVDALFVIESLQLLLSGLYTPASNQSENITENYNVMKEK